MLRRNCLLTMCGFGALLAARGVHAQTSILHVSASIQRRATIRITRVPPTFVATREDFASGWSSVREPVILNVRSNHEDGFLLQVGPLLDIVSAVEISGLDRTVGVGPGGGTMALPTVLGQAHVELGFRFQLARGIRPGVHPWPLQLAAAA